MHKQIEQFRPSVVVVDPVTNFISAGLVQDVRSMLLRLVDYLKGLQITTLMTSLTQAGDPKEQTDVAISSLIDTWLLLRDIELGGERNRGMYILKSRGMAHSNQIREFVLGKRGVELLDVYTGPSGVLTGSARLAQEATEKAEELVREHGIQRRQREMQAERKAVEAQIAALQAKLIAQDHDARTMEIQEQARQKQRAVDQGAMARSRRAEAPGSRGGGKRSH